jgi:hypothetical protein
MASTWEYQPQQGSMQLSVAEQKDIDWSLLVNGRIIDEVLQNRPGWEIIKAPKSYATVADPHAPTGFSYSPSAYDVAYTPGSNPLGAYLFSAPDGNEYILSISTVGAGSPFPLYEIYNTTGRRIRSGILYPVYNGEYLDTTFTNLRNDPTDQTYCFARFYDTVFFCNGGYLWKWQPLQEMNYPQVIKCYHNPLNVNAGNYITDYIYGPSIVAVHNGCLLLSGFKADTIVDMEASVLTQNSGITTNDNPSQTRGILTTPNAQGLKLTPYDILVSDNLAPECYQIAGAYQAPVLSPISALVSHTGRLVVFSQTEMGIITGSVFPAVQISYQIISTGIGCMGKRAWCQTSEGLLVFLGDTNIYAWDGSSVPQIISEPIQQLFRQGTQGFWRWSFTPDSPDVGQISGQPFRVLTSKSDNACAVWNSTDGYVAFAVTSGTQRENNDLVLCWSPASKQWWIDSAEAAKPNYEYDPTPGSEKWSIASTTLGSAAVGKFTLLSSEFEPWVMFSQSYSYPDATLDSSDTYVCALRGETDDKSMHGGSGELPEKNRYAFMAISAPVNLGDSDNKLMRRLHLRTMGYTASNFSAFLYPLKLYVIPEIGHVDVITSEDTTSVASEQKLSTMAESQSDQAVWQDNTATYVSGMYGGTGPLPVGWKQSYIKMWYPLAPVDRRIDIPARVLQWFRVAFTKVVSDTTSSPVQILTTSVELVPNYGTRRG